MPDTPSIQSVIDTILAEMTDSPLEESVDTVKTGDPSRPITGIVTTFLANCSVIEKTIELGANLIITHEPTFYDHMDEVDWLQDSQVYQAKRKLIDDHHIVIWRLHDHIHFRMQPDGIITGTLQALGWTGYARPDIPYICTIPPISLSALVMHLKAKLAIPAMRIVGPSDLICQRVGLIVGAAGGRWQIDAFEKYNLDLVICGESREWETCEYVRDSNRTGRPRALISVGHAISEEKGMQWLVGWLHEHVPGVEVIHVPAGDPFYVL